MSLNITQTIYFVNIVFFLYLFIYLNIYYIYNKFKDSRVLPKFDAEWGDLLKLIFRNELLSVSNQPSRKLYSMILDVFHLIYSYVMFILIYIGIYIIQEHLKNVFKKMMNWFIFIKKCSTWLKLKK